ncbi:MAG: putative toxin-antitoxin system toxin component, PIN family [candidate division KSB1 bacterium]|nr:putative toxin-antitoxin system toxin component, PIN family [candidate division KSB1 bacterium]MDZ7304140.1 putative toxin-antitoxin system toxin component, PIN family [candidate division KSB1 bacterium]MDZ7314096.1 putative toxin-antitoxin system toxin component, PIN family [candidate division KSB1 bacterium]
MIRTVFDTNPLVASIINPKGYPAQLLGAWRRREFEIIVSSTIMQEYRRVLFLPEVIANSRTTETKINELLAALEANAILVPGALDLRVIANDPTDDKFFVAAVEGKADYIITKEQAWKKLKVYKGIGILSPSKFYEILRKLRKG